MKINVIQTPNDGPPLQEVWAFIARDAEGRENTLGGFIFPSTTPLQLMTGNPKTFQLFKTYALEARRYLEGTGKTIHLLHFTTRTEIEEW
jgi:hypothetical protein